MISAETRFRLAAKARLRFDRKSSRYMLLYPERGLVLNPTAADVLQRCDGERTVGSIVAELARQYGHDAPRGGARGARLPPDHGRSRPRAGGGVSGGERPYTLVAELTYRCPLRCVYCSNPLDYARQGEELDTATWIRVLGEAEDLGVVQLNLTGGEPLVRDDLEALVAEARRLDLYTNLITSGVPLRRERLAQLRALGLDNVQISIQDTEAAPSDRIAGRRSFDRKLEVAGWVKELGFPLTLNIVLHRENLDRVEAVIALAERLGADRLELANAQYLGWALPNRAALLPSRAQLARAREVAAAARRGCGDRWRSCSSRPTTTRICPRPAWTGGDAASSC